MSYTAEQLDQFWTMPHDQVPEDAYAPGGANQMMWVFYKGGPNREIDRKIEHALTRLANGSGCFVGNWAEETRWAHLGFPVQDTPLRDITFFVQGHEFQSLCDQLALIPEVIAAEMMGKTFLFGTLYKAN